MTIRLWVNGDLKQDSDSGQLIFRFLEQIAYLSRQVTLHPGDVIATGTPGAAGCRAGNFLNRAIRFVLQSVAWENSRIPWLQEKLDRIDRMNRIL